MALFDIPTRATKEQDIAIAGKSKTKAKSVTTVRSSNGLLGRIAEIKTMVERNLGKFAKDYEIITSKQRLQDYLKKCVLNHIISIDTETTGLDPIQDKIVGLCLYTPNEKAAYVPINHVSYITHERLDNQLTEEEVADELRVVTEYTMESIMFNANFDIRVIRNQLGIRNIKCTWDCYLASRLMNENETHKGLKALHKKYVLDGKGDAFSFDELFKGLCFNLIPIDAGYLYAAHDAIITYEYYQFQKKYLYYDCASAMSDRNGMNGVAWVFFNIEMPCVNVVCDMEDNGIELDLTYASELSVKYHKLLQEKVDNFYDICQQYQNDIDAYRHKDSNNKLDNPINIGSSKQIAILLYDILKIDPPDKKNLRGTGVEILSKIDNPIAKAILDYREVQKLISTYIDKLPECINPNDGRIHCNFNQYGADTGRFSSNDPNLQNIPSHNKDIRKMFKATDDVIEVIESDSSFIVDRWSEVNTTAGWKYASDIVVGDELLVVDNGESMSISVSKIDVLVDRNQIVYYY